MLNWLLISPTIRTFLWPTPLSMPIQLFKQPMVLKGNFKNNLEGALFTCFWIYAVRPFQAPHTLFFYQELFDYMHSYVQDSVLEIQFFLLKSTSASQDFLEKPLHFTLYNSFDNNLNSSLLSFTPITLRHHFSLQNYLLFFKVFKPKLSCTGSPQVVTHTPKCTCMHLTVWTLMLWHDTY